MYFRIKDLYILTKACIIILPEVISRVKISISKFYHYLTHGRQQSPPILNEYVDEDTQTRPVKSKTGEELVRSLTKIKVQKLLDFRESSTNFKKSEFPIVLVLYLGKIIDV